MPGARVVKKAYPEERVGVLAQQGNGVVVVEYRRVSHNADHPDKACGNYDDAAPQGGAEGMQPAESWSWSILAICRAVLRCGDNVRMSNSRVFAFAQ